MDENFTNKDWFEYIKKLNDRELSSKSSDGLTLWAIMGLFAYLLFQLITNIPYISIPQNRQMILLYITVVTNTISCILVIFNSILDFSDNGERTIINELKAKTDKLSRLVICTWLFAIGLLNLYIGYTLRQININSWSFYIIGAYYIISILFSILSEKLRSLWAKLNQYPKVELNTSKIIKSHKSIRITVNIISILFFVIVFFQIRGILNVLPLSNYDTFNLKISLQMLGIVFSVLIFTNKYIQSIKDSWLKGFEKKIIIENLTSDKIKLIFIEEYIGKTTLSWLRNYSADVEERLTLFYKSATDLNNKFLDFDLEDTDTDDALTILELNIETYEKISSSKEELTKYINEKIEYLKNFPVQGPLTKVEQDFVTLVYKDWIKKIESYINFFTSEVKPNFERNKELLNEIKSKLKTIN